MDGMEADAASMPLAVSPPPPPPLSPADAADYVTSDGGQNESISTCIVSNCGVSLAVLVTNKACIVTAADFAAGLSIALFADEADTAGEGLIGSESASNDKEEVGRLTSNFDWDHVSIVCFSI